MWKIFLLATVITSFQPVAVFAQLATPTHAVTILPSYVCMALNLSPSDMMNPNVEVPIFSGPTSDSNKVARATAIVIVSSPEVTSNGYARVLRLNGITGWISEKYIKTWVNPGGNGDHCYPALLSNGRIGFEFHK